MRDGLAFDPDDPHYNDHIGTHPTLMSTTGEGGRSSSAARSRHGPRGQPVHDLDSSWTSGMQAIDRYAPGASAFLFLSATNAWERMG